MEIELRNEIKILRNDLADLRYMLHKKIGGGSADVRANIVAPSSLSSSVSIPSSSITKTQISYEEITVNVTAGQPSGTGTCTSGSVIIGYRSAGNVDQLVDNIALSGTTITVTLATNATAQNNFVVICLKA